MSYISSDYYLYYTLLMINSCIMPKSMLHLDPKTYHRHKKVKKKPNLSLLDRAVLVASVIYPLSGIPQIVSVFSGKTEGVSITSWLLFMLCASLFLIYGIKHRVLPMVISNIIWVVVDYAVVFGILMNKVS